MAKNRFTVEEAFTELSQIINELEDPNLPLDASMALYKKGVKLLERCQASLDKTEKEMIVLKEKQDRLFTEDSMSPGEPHDQDAD